MRRGSVVGPLILIAIGVLFLINNLNPELSVMGILSRFWPFLLIGWGILRLIEILYWSVRGKPLPASGISGGEWVLIVFIALVGSSLYFVNERVNWPPFQMRMKGVEVFGHAYDYPIEERTLAAGASPRVVIENSRGNVRVIGVEGSDVTVSGRKTIRAFNQPSAEQAAGRIRFEAIREGETIFVRSIQQNHRDDQFATTDLELNVPKAATVETRGRRGDLDFTLLNGDILIDSDNAGIRLEDIGGSVRVETRASDLIRAIGVKGTVDLKGYGHDVELENIAGQVTVSGNYFGELQFRNISKPVRFEGGVRRRTSTVSVEACPGQIRLSRGDLTMEGVVGPVVVTARSKDVRISDFTESLQVQVDRGDIEVRPARVPVPRMSVETDSGRIDLVMPDNARFALRGSVNRGEIHNEFGAPLSVQETGRGATITGTVGAGPEVVVRSDRGSLRVAKGTGGLSPRPLVPGSPPKPPALPVPPDAEKALTIEHH